jgi:beta-phosphoglucomutase-like phosphatase (HAD superfamily)
VAFEDSQAGTLAARRAGLWVVAVPNQTTAHHAFDHADWKIASLDEVRLPELMSRFSGD